MILGGPDAESGPLSFCASLYWLKMDSSHRLPTDTDDGLLLIISGPSGVGKTTITRGVERGIADAVFSVSCTTRPKTDADVEGVDYHFVDDATFEQMKAEGQFIETAGIYGKKYGTPKAWVLEQLRRGRLVILEIDVEGAKQVKAQIPGAFAIFVLPPSEHALLDRLQSRKRESEAAIMKRFSAAQSEIDNARTCELYDVFIVNENVEPAIAQAISAVQERRARRR
jgi:guanylate kinase